MRLMSLCVRSRTLLAFMLALLLASQNAVLAAADDASPFDKLAGRWVGEGRLGVRDSPSETVRCRVTYFVEEGGHQLRQSIRCATQSGAIEVASTVTHAGGRLAGTWQERTRNWAGDVTGTIHPHGFKVAVRGENLTANMDIVVKGERQIIEIQFLNSSLIGLTLVLTKG
jgi:hypothetical protein